jgi:hypothetical protein
MKCKICDQEMVNTPATVDNWKCAHQHGGTQPRVGAAVLDCPLAKGAIWVHVIDDNGDDVPDIPASILGGVKPTKAGFASWDPLEDTPHDVTIGRLPVEFWPLAVVTAEKVPVRKGEITSVQFILERVAEMNVIVREGEKPDSVKDIQVDVTRVAPKESTRGTTLAVTGAKFPKLHKGDHTVKITLTKEQQDQYWIDGAAEKSRDVLLHNLNKVEFTLQLVVWLEVIFRVQLVKAGTATELTGAKVKLKEPDEEKAAELAEEKAVAKFKAKQTGREEKPPVEVVSLTPDGTADMYEVVEIVTE